VTPCYCSAPTVAMPADTLESLFEGGPRARGQQQPLHRRSTLRPLLLQQLHGPELDRVRIARLPRLKNGKNRGLS